MATPAALKPTPHIISLPSRTIPKQGVAAVEVFFRSPALCTIRKNPGMAWQEVCAEVINILVERQQMEACRKARKIMQARGELPSE